MKKLGKIRKKQEKQGKTIIFSQKTQISSKNYVFFNDYIPSIYAVYTAWSSIYPVYTGYILPGGSIYWVYTAPGSIYPVYTRSMLYTPSPGYSSPETFPGRQILLVLAGFSNFL